MTEKIGIATGLQRRNDMIYSSLEIPRQLIGTRNDRIKKLFTFWEQGKGSPDFVPIIFFFFFF